MANRSSPEYLAKKQRFDSDLQARKNEELAKVLAAANKVILAYSGREGIDLVLQEAVYIAPEYDITDTILPLLR